jgi:hypothetical protein
MPRQRLVAPRGKGGKKAILDVRHDRAFKRLAALVSKEEWKEVLGYFPDNAKAVQLLILLSNPLFNKATLGKLAVMSGLSTAELTLFLNSAKKQEGIVRMSQKLPDIMEETAIDALPTDEPCVRCDGTGQLKKGPCPHCRSTGSIRVKGDLDNRKLVLEMAGLIGKRGSGQAIQINVGGSRSLEERVGIAQQLLTEPIIDAEEVKDVTPDDGRVEEEGDS